jgi:hypothetical protein
MLNGSISNKSDLLSGHFRHAKFQTSSKSRSLLWLIVFAIVLRVTLHIKQYYGVQYFEYFHFSNPTPEKNACPVAVLTRFALS